MASGTEQKPAETPASSIAPPSGGSKIALILTGVNTVVTLAMVGILFVSFQKQKSGASVGDIAAHSEGGGHGEASGGGHGESGGGEHGGGGGASSHKKPGDFGRMVTLEQFTINLSTPGSAMPKFARVNVSLEVPNEDAEQEVTSKMPQVRNAIIDLFNSKRTSDLATAEGRDDLKKEIMNALNSFISTGKIRGVFFTNFALSG